MTRLGRMESGEAAEPGVRGDSSQWRGGSQAHVSASRAAVTVSEDREVRNGDVGGRDDKVAAGSLSLSLQASAPHPRTGYMPPCLAPITTGLEWKAAELRAG